VTYRPKQLSRELPAHVVALASLGQLGRIAIYAGAGISLGEPTGLPNGKDLARAIHRRLLGSFPVLQACADDDILAIADAVAAQPNGGEALRLSACSSAEFTTATPGFAHRALAYLLLEGMVDVLTTNWDDCIERGSESERVGGVINQSDLLKIVGKSVLKVHGCATQPSTVLVTTDDLTHPPIWVVDEVRARLGNSVVVFVGIGDVAGYVETRLKEALNAVADVDNVRVVSPSIQAKWATSQWATNIPQLAEQHRIPQSADEFLDDLASGHVRDALQHIVAAFASDAAMLHRLESAVVAIEAHDVETVLRWLRRCAVVPRKGESVLRAHPLPDLLAALGVLAGDSFKIGSDGLIRTGTETFQVLTATAPVPWTRVWREASNRLEAMLSSGWDPGSAPWFLVAGGLGTRPASSSLPDDVLSTGDQYDIVAGPANAVPRCLTVEEVLAA